MNIPILLFAILLISTGVSAQSSDETVFRIGSPAVIWNQRGSKKGAYLDGMCEGLGSNKGSTGGDFVCQPGPQRGLRFCTLVHRDDAKREAISVIDNFYKDKQHSHIPMWAAIAVYNDKACGENTVLSVVSKMQKRNECLYILMEVGLALTSEARKKQEAHCEALKF
jgi:hypothetical protein